MDTTNAVTTAVTDTISGEKTYTAKFANEAFEEQTTTEANPAKRKIEQENRVEPTSMQSGHI